MPTYAYIRPAYAGPCLHMQAEGFLGLYFQKIDLFALKNCIFHFNISQVNLESDWALNQPWALEF